MYMQLLTSNPCTSVCVHKSKYFWSFPHKSLNNLTFGLPNALGMLRFDPPFFGVLYNEPLRYIEEEELKSK